MSVIQLYPNQNIPDQLRKLADDLEAKVALPHSCSVLVDGDIYNWGSSDDEVSVVNLLWDLEVSKQQIMARAVGDQE